MSWSRFVAPIMLACLLGGCSASSSKPGAAEEYDVYEYVLAQAIQQSVKGDYAEAYPALVSVVESRSFAAFEPARQHAALMMAGLVALELNKAKEAHAFLVRSSSMPDASEHDWTGRFHAAWQLGNSADATLSLTRLAQRWPQELAGVNHQVVHQLVRQARHAQGAGLYDLLAALYTAGWKLEGDSEPSPMWRDLALLHLENDRAADALQVASRVTNPHVLISMIIDKRFDPMRALAPAKFDVDAAVEAEIAFWRAAVERAPRMLDNVVQLSYSMLGAGRYREALELTTGVIEKVEAAGDKNRPYDDFDEAYIWILDNRARALRATEQWVEAEVEIREAANRKENGHRNVSNVINLAWFYVEMGRADDALATLVDVGQDMSPYGLMQMHAVRCVAALQKQDRAIADESIAYLEAHQQDAVSTWQWVLIAADRLDEAAAVLIGRLRDPLLRSDALADLQEYAEPPQTAQTAVWNERARSLSQRADVKAAIEAVGRVQKFSIPPAPV